ncbi:MAG: T9SS type A sorting domain-containing protein [Bacteroidales bacterium]|nr:T9SS type A sorting domain-containing protein [Bacteroidales bacterium]
MTAKTTHNTLYSLFILLGALLTGFSLRAGNEPEVMIDHHIGCVGNEVAVAVKVHHFDDIMSFTLFIEVDTSNLAYTGLDHVNESLASGNLVSNFSYENPPALNINWVGNSSVDLNDEKLFNIHFMLKDTTGVLDMGSNCEIVNADLSVVDDAVFTGGSITVPAVVIPQPNHLEVPEEEVAYFEVFDFANATFQWQMLMADNWVNIQDDPAYDGANTHQLSVHTSILEVNEAKYRCKLSSASCSGITAEASLLVDPAGLQESTAGSKNNVISVYPNPAEQKIWIAFNDQINDATIQICDAMGRTRLLANMDCLITKKPQQLEVHSLEPGIYILQLFAGKQIKATETLIIE